MYVDETDPEWPLMWAALRASERYLQHPDPDHGRWKCWRYTHTDREHEGVDHCFVYRSVVAILGAARIPATAEFAARSEAVALVCWLAPSVQSIEGAAAFRAGDPLDSMPHADPCLATHWRGGWEMEAIAAADGTPEFRDRLPCGCLA